jgi:hypothetical protein
MISIEIGLQPESPSMGRFASNVPFPPDVMNCYKTPNFFERSLPVPMHPVRGLVLSAAGNRIPRRNVTGRNPVWGPAEPVAPMHRAFSGSQAGASQRVPSSNLIPMQSTLLSWGTGTVFGDLAPANRHADGGCLTFPYFIANHLSIAKNASTSVFSLKHSW